MLLAMPWHGPTLIPHENVVPRHGVAYKIHKKENGITRGDPSFFNKEKFYIKFNIRLLKNSG
jgi:hypothetical protein